MPKTAVTALSVLFLIGAAANADAQSDNQGNPTILKAVQDLQKSVDTLSSQVSNIANQGTNITNQLTSITTELTSITNLLNTIVAPPTTISTSFRFKPAGYSAGCSAQNVGTSSVTLNLELVKINGQVFQSLPNLTLAAGNGNGFGLAIGSLANTFWCRFTVVSGSSANLRATLDITNEATGLGEFVEAR